MKKKLTIIILSAIVLLSAILSACDIGSGITQSSSENQSSADASLSDFRIKELEAKISAILQDQQLSESESKKAISELKAEIEELKKQASSTDKKPDESGSQSSQTEKFKYTVENGVAVITKIITDEENLVIPSSLDGYRVYSVAGEAFSSATVKSISITSGIEKLDWFAFKNCPSLTSVSIPDSVISIGYGAFDNCSKSFVIRCSKDSFAHRYAQSYGITYDIT